MSVPDSCARLLPRLLVALLITSIPPAGFAQAADSPIGSVRGAGEVELRGIPVQGTGTLFSGSRVETREGGYARIALDAGAQVGLDESTVAGIAAGDAGVDVMLEAGALGFAAHRASGAFGIRAGTWQVQSRDESAANVALLGDNELGVRTLSGTVTVRSTLSDEAIVIREGDAQIISLSDEVAGAAGPEPPRRQLTGREWIGVAIVAGAIGTAVTAWLILRDDASPN